MKNRKHNPFACGLYIKSDYPDILEDEHESYCGDDPQNGGSTDVIIWFISRMSYYNKLFEEIFSIFIPLKEDSNTPLTIQCYYCNKNMSEDIVRDHDHPT